MKTKDEYANFNITGFHPTEKQKEYPPKNPPNCRSAGVRSYMRGNQIYYDGNDWRYTEDNTLADDSKPCVRCGHMPTPEGYDYCLGYIDGVSAACCGHGVSKSYISHKANNEKMNINMKGVER